MADLSSKRTGPEQVARSGNPTGESRFSERPDGKDAERERLQKKAANKAQEIWEAAEALAQMVLRGSPSTRVRYVKPDIEGDGDLNDELKQGLHHG